MSDFIKVLGDIKLSGSLSYANNLADFPANPDPRTIVVKEGMPYIFTELKNGSGFFTWMPLGLKHANYLHTQGAPSQTWTISHGFGTTNFAYFVYDSDHNMVIANIKYIDDNTSQILLSSAMTGTAVFFALGEISVPVISVASGLKLSNITLTEGANGRLEVDTQPVALMSDIVGLGNGLGTLGTDFTAQLASKADQSTTYTIVQTDQLIGNVQSMIPDVTGFITSDAANSAIALKAAQATTYTKTETDARIQAVVGAAPAALDTLVEIAAQLNADESAATALTNAVSLKAPLASPVFTGTVSGITASMVGAYSTAQSDAALALKADASAVTALTGTVATKAPLASPTFTGTVSGISASMVGAYTTAQVDAALAAKSTLASPAFTGTVTAPTPTAGDNTAAVATTAFVTNAVKVTSVAGKTGAVTLAKADVGLGNVDNTADASKPVSTAQAAAIALKADQATTYSKTETDSRIQAVVGAAPAALDTLVEIAAQLTADESAATALTNAVSLKAPLASPVFTGTVSGITASMVGAYTKAEVDTAVATKAPLASPSFTGTVSVSGIAIDGLGTIDTATLTTSATTASQVLDTNSSTLARTVKYLVQVTSGTSYQSIEMMVLHDGTTANLVQYANMSTGVDLATFDADVSGGNVRLLVTPVNAVTTFKAIKTVVAV
jgi:hypothetical protein